MSNPNEQSLQNKLIDFFQNDLGYEHLQGYQLIDQSFRKNNKEFLLKPILNDYLAKINKGKTTEQIESAILEIEKITEPNLTLANKQFYQLIKNGIDTFHSDRKQYEKVFLFDKENFDNNHFLVVDEFTFTADKTKRIDLTVFVNGIPLVIIELKNPYDENTTIDKAFNQIKTYQNDIKELFITNAFSVISNEYNNGVGTITSSLERFNEFKSQAGQKGLEYHFEGLFSKGNFIKIIFNYLIFTNENKKIIANYHQFFATEKIIEKSIIANQNNDSQVGVVWHTTGSGKSFTMTFVVKQLLQKLKPLIILLTDRIDLDDQLHKTFANSANFLGVNQALKQIKSRQDLINCLKQNTKSEIITTTIQKFLKDENQFKFDELSKRGDIFIIVDEAHRSQYDLKDGLARNIRLALPNAKFIGFTGTPIELEDKNTKLIFGDYIDKYVMSRAVEDKTTVPIHYEPRLAKIRLNKQQFIKLDDEVEEIFKLHQVNEKDKQVLKMEALIGESKRLELIAKDFINHYLKRSENIFGKALFTCYSRKIAVKFYNILEKIKPQWFSEDDTKGEVKLVISGSSSDTENFQKHIRNKEKLREIENRFKKETDELKIVIVANMWLTGFDVPCLHTLYVDKPIKEHSLIQAISRVNRVYPNKDSGLIVDYIGIGEFLKRAIYHFSDQDKKEITTDFDQVLNRLIEYYELTKSCFNGFNYQDYFKLEDKSSRDEIVKDGVDKILREEKYKKDFLLNSLKLIKTYSLCPLDPKAQKLLDEINYFKLVRLAILQLENTIQTKSNEIQLEHQLSRVVSRSIEARGIVDIYDFVGIDKPELSILSDDFFNEIKNLKQKNMAFELLKKVLEDKIKLKTKGNVIQEKKFSEKLKEIINQYINKTIESAKVIEELIAMSKEIDKSDEEKKKLGLNDDEIKFYDAVAQINDQEEVMKKEILRDLAKELVLQIRENKTIDWDKRESTKAKMRRMIKRLLKKYGYPPNDDEEKAKELVLEQAKIFCEGGGRV